MKFVPVVLEASFTLWLLGCAATSVAVAPVGPNPQSSFSPDQEGQLQVYSSLVARVEGNNPTWYQHSDYVIYDQSGNRVKYVGNITGRYAQSPRSVNLPPGRYFVRAAATDYLRVEVPVVIAPGRSHPRPSR